jgi:uncharacterized protein involved in exopolysaccharide biosynthesis
MNKSLMKEMLSKTGINKVTLTIFFLPFFISFLVGILSKPVFQSETILAASNDSSSSILGSGSGVQGSIISSFLQSDSSLVQKTIATANSKSFLGGFVEKHNLFMAIGLQGGENKWILHREMLERFVIERVDSSSLYSLRVQLNDPQLSANMSNKLVEELNLFMRQKELDKIKKNIVSLKERISSAEKSDTRKMLYSILGTQVNLEVMISSDPEYVFTIIDKASTPVDYIWPNSLYLVAISFVASILLLYFYFILKEKIISRAAKN